MVGEKWSLTSVTNLQPLLMPGHAGVKFNEKADQLAATAVPTDQLPLLCQDIALLCQYTTRQTISESLCHSEEGDRLLSLMIPFATSRDSHDKGPERCFQNQIRTGNISKTTLLQLLAGRDKAERVCEVTNSMTPSCGLK